MIKLLLLNLGICFSSGILYRAGGKGKPYNTKYRDLGCPLMLLLTIFCLFGFQPHFTWSYILCFLLSWVALSTYWDEVFGYDNFYAHGLGCGLAGLPLILVIPWQLILIRLIICTLGMGLWSKFVKKDIPQEIGRGILFII